MNEIKIIDGGICAAKGFTASGVHCGIRKNRTKRDIALIFSEKKASAAAVYTTNLVKGAPLTVTKKHISDGFAQAVEWTAPKEDEAAADLPHSEVTAKNVFASDDKQVNGEHIFTRYYSNVIHFEGEHRMDNNVITDVLIPRSRHISRSIK